MDRLLLLSTCGTSLLSNGADPGLRKWLTDVANGPVVDDPRLQELVRDRRTRLGDADDASRRRLSAELNGIGAALERWKPGQVFHLLVHTDTALGRASATLVEEVLERQGQAALLLTAGGLRTDDLPSFRDALADLTRQVEEQAKGYREQGWNVVFNLTGGFKSLNAYLQALGMLYADRCVFLFEGASALMEIPRLPVQLVEADEVRTHLQVFRRLAVGYRVAAEEAHGVPDALLLIDDGQVTTSVWGDIVWARVRRGLLAESLQPPLSARVEVRDAVKRAFRAIEADERIQANEALDEFSAHLDLGRPLPKSRTFKRLQGDPVPGSTHELYAWSSGATGRLFGHREDGGSFVFDRLGGHL